MRTQHDRARGSNGLGEGVTPSPTDVTLLEKGNEAATLKKSLARDIRDILLKIALVVAIIALAWYFVFGLMYAGDLTMFPAVHSADVVLYYRLDERFLQNDLAVVSYEGARQIRRVVAKAGDEVDIRDGRLIVNGAVQQERSIHNETEQLEGGVSFPLTVPEGHIFVLTDDRISGSDSRIYGPVSVEDTHGKVVTLLRKRGF